MLAVVMKTATMMVMTMMMRTATMIVMMRRRTACVYGASGGPDRCV